MRFREVWEWLMARFASPEAGDARPYYLCRVGTNAVPVDVLLIDNRYATIDDDGVPRGSIFPLTIRVGDTTREVELHFEQNIPSGALYWCTSPGQQNVRKDRDPHELLVGDSVFADDTVIGHVASQDEQLIVRLKPPKSSAF